MKLIVQPRDQMRNRKSMNNFKQKVFLKTAHMYDFDDLSVLYFLYIYI